MKSKTLKIALPAGSLKESTFDLFRRAGFELPAAERSYFPKISDTEIECTLIRAQEIPRYVSLGKFDLGITGKDWIEESGYSLKEIAELGYSKNGSRSLRLVVAVPEGSAIADIRELSGKTIATEFVRTTKGFLENAGIAAAVEFSWGATESKPPYLADAIVDLVDSGRSLRENGLRILATLLETTTRVVVNEKSYEEGWKRQKADALAQSLAAALTKRTKGN
jgi:ATP phosphoribosyltransferase